MFYIKLVEKESIVTHLSNDGGLKRGRENELKSSNTSKLDKEKPTTLKRRPGLKGQKISCNHSQISSRAKTWAWPGSVMTSLFNETKWRQPRANRKPGLKLAMLSQKVSVRLMG